MPGSSGGNPSNPVFNEATGQVALEMGRQTLLAASNAAQQGLVQVHHYIQQGPNGLRVLCFVGGLGVTLTGALGVLNIFSTILHPIDYLCNAYQFLFGVITCILEANPELLRERVHWQEKIYEHAKFLTLLWGRGLFYLFQGSLALVQFTLLYAIVGVYMVVMGVLCIAMWKGYQPDLGGVQQTIAEQTGRFVPANSDAIEGGMVSLERQGQQQQP
ncbi:hypothetical protein FOZ62_005889 [Perkinsus olseni]|uniref:COPI associated protein n=2 Tax=Perkinsus olseni TaxID=32597 RepID=A0A7J6R0L9_PEROL|nr:hypothetical protein FOZ62_005889 [Perkinsus olseni]